MIYRPLIQRQTRLPSAFGLSRFPFRFFFLPLTASIYRQRRLYRHLDIPPKFANMAVYRELTVFTLSQTRNFVNERIPNEITLNTKYDFSSVLTLQGIDLLAVSVTFPVPASVADTYSYPHAEDQVYETQTLGRRPSNQRPCYNDSQDDLPPPPVSPLPAFLVCACCYHISSYRSVNSIVRTFLEAQKSHGVER